MWKVTVQKFSWDTSKTPWQEYLGEPVIHYVRFDMLSPICNILQGMGYKLIGLEETETK